MQSHFIVKPNLVLRLGWGFDNDQQGPLSPHITTIAVAFLHGRRIGTNSTIDTCDNYSLTDNVWTDGPDQPFNRTNNDEFDTQFKFWMATAGPTVVAAYQGNPYYPDFEPQVYQMSTLGEEGWSEPTSLGVSFGEFTFFDMIALDEKHVALTGSIQYPPNETICITNAETVRECASII